MGTFSQRRRNESDSITRPKALILSHWREKDTQLGFGIIFADILVAKFLEQLEFLEEGDDDDDEEQDDLREMADLIFLILFQGSFSLGDEEDELNLGKFC
jgi:hypothetical protein